jgi:hypothetical protein
MPMQYMEALDQELDAIVLDVARVWDAIVQERVGYEALVRDVGIPAWPHLPCQSLSRLTSL